VENYGKGKDLTGSRKEQHPPKVRVGKRTILRAQNVV
jgi:hypothetical protein